MMEDKKKFINSIDDSVTDLFQDNDLNKFINTIIECCAVVAENNTNDTGDYDVGADIAGILRKIRMEKH